MLEEEDVDLYNVFIYAPLEYRIERVKNALGLTDKKTKDRILKTDKQRKTYYGYYSNREWGKMSNYDICINSQKFGIEKAAKMIVDYMRGND